MDADETWHQYALLMRNLGGNPNMTSNNKHNKGLKSWTVDWVTIVTGLPRSGTSMMMRMLASGGMNIVTDNIRRADVDNPKGYYELEKVKQIGRDSSWLEETKGKVFKMVSMLLYELPEEYEYKIIFMKRHMDEILASQKKMLERQKEKNDAGKRENVDYDKMGRLYTKHLMDIEMWLKKQNNMDVLFVNYNELLSEPRIQLQTIDSFLGRRLNIDEMANVVDTSLYRNRATPSPISR
jgi:hypothetical protein